MVFATLIAAVALYCGARVAVPGWRDKHHTYDMDVMHVLMGTAMVAMFLSTIPGWASAPAMAVFAGGVVWFAVRGLRPMLRAALLRLSATCLAMFYMLMPIPANAEVSHHGTHAHQMSDHGAASTSIVGITMVAAMAVVAVAAAVSLVRPHRERAGRLSSVCEFAMATAMGYMLAIML